MKEKNLFIGVFASLLVLIYILIHSTCLPDNTRQNKIIKNSSLRPISSKASVAIPGSVIGKLYTSPDKQKRKLVKGNIIAQEEENGGKLAFYVLVGRGSDKLEPLYDKDGNIARLAIISADGQHKIKILQDNANIRAFTSQDTRYLTQPLSNARVAQYNAAGKQYYAQHVEGLPTVTMPDGNVHKINVHTYLRGCGQDLRNLVEQAIKSGELKEYFAAQEFILYLIKQISEDKFPLARCNADEIALILHNECNPAIQRDPNAPTKDAVTGVRLLWGRQDVDTQRIGPAANADFTKAISKKTFPQHTPVVKSTTTPAPGSPQEVSIDRMIKTKSRHWLFMLRQAQVIDDNQLLELCFLHDESLEDFEMRAMHEFNTQERESFDDFCTLLGKDRKATLDIFFKARQERESENALSNIIDAAMKRTNHAGPAEKYIFDAFNTYDKTAAQLTSEAGQISGQSKDKQDALKLLEEIKKQAAKDEDKLLTAEINAAGHIDQPRAAALTQIQALKKDMADNHREAHDENTTYEQQKAALSKPGQRKTEVRNLEKTHKEKQQDLRTKRHKLRNLLAAKLETEQIAAMSEKAVITGRLQSQQAQYQNQRSALLQQYNNPDTSEIQKVRDRLAELEHIYAKQILEEEYVRQGTVLAEQLKEARRAAYSAINQQLAKARRNYETWQSHRRQRKEDLMAELRKQQQGGMDGKTVSGLYRTKSEEMEAEGKPLEEAVQKLEQQLQNPASGEVAQVLQSIDELKKRPVRKELITEEKYREYKAGLERNEAQLAEKFKGQIRQQANALKAENAKIAEILNKRLQQLEEVIREKTVEQQTDVLKKHEQEHKTDELSVEIFAAYADWLKGEVQRMGQAPLTGTMLYRRMAVLCTPEMDFMPATPGAPRGKFFRNQNATGLASHGVVAEETTTGVSFYYSDGKNGKMQLYFKDGSPAKLDFVRAGNTNKQQTQPDDGITIKYVKGNGHFQGFGTINRIIYVNDSLDEKTRQAVIWHEKWEIYFIRHREKLPAGVNAHTAIRGCGKRIKGLFTDDIPSDWTDDKVIRHIERHLPETRHNEAEFNLIRYNYEQGKRGNGLLFGLQDEILKGKMIICDLDDFIVLSEIPEGKRKRKYYGIRENMAEALQEWKNLGAEIAIVSGGDVFHVEKCFKKQLPQSRHCLSYINSARINIEDEELELDEAFEAEANEILKDRKFAEVIEQFKRQKEKEMGLSFDPSRDVIAAGHDTLDIPDEFMKANKTPIVFIMLQRLKLSKRSAVSAHSAELLSDIIKALWARGNGHFYEGFKRLYADGESATASRALEPREVTQGQLSFKAGIGIRISDNLTMDVPVIYEPGYVSAEKAGAEKAPAAGADARSMQRLNILLETAA